MGHDVTKALTDPLAGKPGVEVEGRRLDPERRLPEMVEIKVDRVIRRRANRAGNAGEHGHCRAMDMAGGDKLHAGMALDDCCQLSGVA